MMPAVLALGSTGNCLTAAAGFPVPSRIVWRGEYEPNFQLLRRQFDETGAKTVYRYDFDNTSLNINGARISASPLTMSGPLSEVECGGFPHQSALDIMAL
jgi:hypothetical protein